MLPLPVGLLGPGQTWDVDDCHVGLQAASLRDLYRYGFIDERPAIGNLDETFGVKMVQIGSKNDHVMSFRMRGETSFGKLMRAWCSHHGVPLEKLCISMYEDGCFDRELKPEDYLGVWASQHQGPWPLTVTLPSSSASHHAIPRQSRGRQMKIYIYSRQPLAAAFPPSSGEFCSHGCACRVGTLYGTSSTSQTALTLCRKSWNINKQAGE